MQPTIEADLAGARRSLAAVIANETVAADASRDLRGVMRTLQRLEESWARVLPYLSSDNLRISELLRDLGPSCPDDLRSDIEAAVATSATGDDAGSLDAAVANVRNESLRGLLSRTIAAQTPEAVEVNAVMRARIVACLRESLEERPW